MDCGIVTRIGHIFAAVATFCKIIPLRKAHVVAGAVGVVTVRAPTTRDAHVEPDTEDDHDGDSEEPKDHVNQHERNHQQHDYPDDYQWN